MVELGNCRNGENKMKKVKECKEYFKDLLTNCLCEKGLDKSIFGRCTERKIS